MIRVKRFLGSTRKADDAVVSDWIKENLTDKDCIISVTESMCCDSDCGTFKRNLTIIYEGN